MADLTAAERAVIDVFKKAGKTHGEIIKIMLIQDKLRGLGYSTEQINEAIESLIAKGGVEQLQVSFLKLTQDRFDQNQ